MFCIIPHIGSRTYVVEVVRFEAKEGRSPIRYETTDIYIYIIYMYPHGIQRCFTNKLPLITIILLPPCG